MVCCAPRWRPSVPAYDFSVHEGRARTCDLASRGTARRPGGSPLLHYHRVNVMTVVATLTVGLAGFEPAASRFVAGCAVQLRHNPLQPYGQPPRLGCCNRWVRRCPPAGTRTRLTGLKDRTLNP